jgi:hypothetical protein
VEEGVPRLLGKGLAQYLPEIFQILLKGGEEIKVLVVAEKAVDIVCIGQDVASPAVPHSDLQEGCEVFSLMFKER